jgi:hypothetical protein
MTEEQIALARRAVACKGWRWMRGMLTHDGYLMTWCSDTEREWAGPQFSKDGMAWRYARINGDPKLPDLTDPATLGCLLALVREAWEPRRGTDHIASTVHTSTGWGVGARVGSECFAAIILPAFSSEAEALVAALEAAP